jgi:hypothetical protein
METGSNEEGDWNDEHKHKQDNKVGGSTGRRRTREDDNTHGTRPLRYEQLLVGRMAGASDDERRDRTMGR